jgi:hypothetical protein
MPLRTNGANYKRRYVVNQVTVPPLIVQFRADKGQRAQSPQFPRPRIKKPQTGAVRAAPTWWTSLSPPHRG